MVRSSRVLENIVDVIVVVVVVVVVIVDGSSSLLFSLATFFSWKRYGFSPFPKLCLNRGLNDEKSMKCWFSADTSTKGTGFSVVSFVGASPLFGPTYTGVAYVK